MLRQVSLVLALLLISGSAVHAAICDNGQECPSGWITYATYESPNCTGDYSLTAGFNITVPNQCGALYSMNYRATCNSKSLTVSSFTSVGCASNSLTYSQTVPTGTCLALNGGSAVYWCDVADVKNTTKIVRGVPTPSTVGLAPELSPNGNKTIEEGCSNTTGCTDEYPTAFAWPASNGGCTGNASKAFPATAFLPGFSSSWFALDTCYVAYPYEVNNMTINWSCKGGKLSSNLYTGNCQTNAIAAQVAMNSNACIYSAEAELYYKITCPGSDAPSSGSFLSFNALLLVTFALLAFLL